MEDIDSESILLEGAIEPVWAWIDENEQIAMCKFKRSEVPDIVQPGLVDLAVSCELIDGTVFEGSDTLKIVTTGSNRRTER